MKRTPKLLPIILVAMLAACGKKEDAPKAEAPAQQPPVASAPAPAANEAAAPAATPAATPAAATASAPADTSSASGSAGASAGSTAAGGSASAGGAGSGDSSGASTSGSAGSGGDLALGEKIYTANCAACHGAGVLGAPKFGDKTAWGPRISQGKPTLYTHALNGFQGKVGAMPPKGGNASLKDNEVKAAVDYMVSKAS